MAEQVIATENLIVHDDLMGIDRQLIAGQPVPPDLIDAYRAKVGDVKAAQDGGEAAREDPPVTNPEALDVNGMSLDELQAEADRRGLTVEGTGKDGNVLKADLVKALSA